MNMNILVQINLSSVRVELNKYSNNNLIYFLLFHG
jgi:hypothetical protein